MNNASNIKVQNQIWHIEASATLIRNAYEYVSN